MNLVLSANSFNVEKQDKYDKAIEKAVSYVIKRMKYLRQGNPAPPVLYILELKPITKKDSSIT